jgi:hypothetical protein
VLARDLKPGESIRTVDGPAALLSIEAGVVQPVSNLDVAPNRTFFVGSQMAPVRHHCLPPAIYTPFRCRPDAGVHRRGASGAPRLAAAFVDARGLGRGSLPVIPGEPAIDVNRSARGFDCRLQCRGTVF